MPAERATSEAVIPGLNDAATSRSFSSPDQSRRRSTDVITSTRGMSEAATAQGGPLAACKADVKKICLGVAPGGGRLIKCLKQHENDVTIGCAKELKAIKAKMGK
jgi:hypothetical protein